MNWDEIKEKFYSWLTITFILIFIIALVIGIVRSFSTDKEISSPVEEHRIDSLAKENDKIVLEIKVLDSIKNERIYEVKNLNNDSTLKLFYELIGK